MKLRGINQKLQEFTCKMRLAYLVCSFFLEMMSRMTR